jgi:hypothetical protein
MKLWMDVMRDLESVIDNHERLYDAWEAGGVDGLVIGPLYFDSPDLHPGVRTSTGGPPPQPTFDPNPDVYRRFGVTPPEAPQADVAKRKALDQALSAAKDRGWSVWIFQPGAGSGPGGGGHTITDLKTRAATCARIADTLQHYPMADGGIMDGPEWGYEIAPHHMNERSYIFNDLPSSVEEGCARLGYDYDALVAAKDRLFERLHTLDSADIRLHAEGGLVGAACLLGDADLVGWLSFRVDSLMAYFQDVRCRAAEAVSHPIKLGVGPRSAAFAPLCGYDFRRLAEAVDILLPKHYFWHRGFDGLLGTVGRYVETLVSWNPGLSEGDALLVVKSLFGLTLPEVSTGCDLESALTPAFFQSNAAGETRRAIHAAGDAQRVVPWLEAGRTPHDGDPMTAGHLRQLLESARDAGLERFLYHHQGNVTAGEWTVISELCGKPWRQLESTFTPPDRHVL